MGFLQLENKNYVVFGVANRRSIAYAIAKQIEENGGKVLYVVHSKERYNDLSAKLLKGKDIFVCDFEIQKEIDELFEEIKKVVDSIDGLVHSVAFARYSSGAQPFHSILRDDFLQAIDISCFSLIAIVNSFKSLLTSQASIITLSISTTKMASENYGYMGPVKAALDSSVVFLTKSLSKISPEIRVNAVGASLLKTASSAGIPNYIDNYLFAEQVIPRKRALQTSEVANVALFLLSQRSSGINGQTVVVDAAMSINYFDQDIVNKVVK